MVTTHSEHLAATNQSSTTKIPQHEMGTIHDLRRSFPLPPEQFLQHFLQSAAQATGASAGQIWGLDRTGRLSKISSVQPEQFQPLEYPAHVQQYRKLISQALYGGQPLWSRFRENEATPPTESKLFLAPYFFETDPIGVVEFVFPSALEPSAQQSITRLVGVLSEYFSGRSEPAAGKSRETLDDAQRQQTEVSHSRLRGKDGKHGKDLELRDPQHLAVELQENKRSSPSTVESINRLPTMENSNPSTTNSESSPAPIPLDPQDIESFVLLLHNQPELDYVSGTAVNETRRMLQCDRVSMALHRGEQTEIIAISGQDRVETKSNAVRAMREIATQVIATSQSVGINGSHDATLGEQPEKVTQYISESGVSSFQIVPLFEPERIRMDEDVHSTEQRTFAALLVEQFSDRPCPSSQNVQRLASHISQATFHALQQEQIFLLPARRSLGRVREKLKLSRTKSWLLVGLLAFSAALFTFVKIPYRIVATGRLMPVGQFRAFAPFEGEVQQVLVSSGQSVETNQPLLRLENESMTTRRLILSNSATEKSKLLAAFKAQLNESPNALPSGEKISLNAKIAQYDLEVQSLQQQLKLVDDQLQRTVVRSEINGTVATFQPHDLLAGRPVNRGELLLEVMNEGGPWQLELSLPAKRLGHLLELQPVMHTQALKDRPTLTFVPATTPGKTYRGSISNIATRAASDENGATTILLNATVPDSQTLRRTIGAEVTAKIDCGRKSLGYVCFGDILDWIQGRIW